MVENAGELWKGAKLNVILLRELPSVPKLYLPVPVNVDTKDEDLLILKRQNPDIPMDSWNVLRIGKILNGRVFVTICIDKEGLAILEQKNHILHMAMGDLVDENPDDEENIIRELSNAKIDDVPEAPSSNPN
uniref:DUF4780 domain-containing protein n=1 Tax=Megaselia scalaris TaxID=36166 RepID=T1H3M5_MEGSC